MTNFSESPVDRAVAEAARRWVGTPYVHQASVRGVGCDCLGLVRGVWREIHGAEPVAPMPYSRDLGEVGNSEPVLDLAATVLEAVSTGEAFRGAVLVFRWRPFLPAKHMGIALSPDRFVHAWERAGKVTEVTLPPFWRRRIAAMLRFPQSG